MEYYQYGEKKLKIKNRRKFFFIRLLDAHIYIELLTKIKLSLKYKPNIKHTRTTEWGLNTEDRETQVIVSLTSYPERINLVATTIDTLLQQVVKPDKLILWLAESQFPNKESDLPENLLEQCKYGLEIRWTEDLKSYKKLIPALKEFPDAIIVTADDDLYYQSDWLESLYSAFLKDPEYIYTRRATFININNDTINVFPHYANKHYKPCFNNQLMGGAGTLYPPHFLHQDILNIEAIKNLIPTHDDIYIWAMAILNNKKIKLIKNRDVNLITVDGTQQFGLCKINKGIAHGMNPLEAFTRIIEKYPQIVKKLKDKP